MNQDPLIRRSVESMLRTDLLREQIITEASLLGPGVLEALATAGVSISAVPFGARLADYASKARKYGITVPVGASGVFLPSEATLYMLDDTRATAVHELAHALDFTMGRGRDAGDGEASLKTQIDPEFARHMRGNGESPTPYGETNTQEFFAESLRAYCGADNAGTVFAATGPWKLRVCNRPTMLALTSLMIEFNGRRFEGLRDHRTRALPSRQ